MANIERLFELRETVVEIDRLQKSANYKGPRWDQEIWRTVNLCGTRMCAAGWTNELDARRRNEQDSWVDDGPFLRASADEIENFPAYVQDIHDDNGHWVQVVETPWRARRLLGLTEDQADELFYDTDDIDDLMKVIDRFVAEERAKSDE